MIYNYDQFEFEDAKRDAFNKWADHLLEIISKP